MADDSARCFDTLAADASWSSFSVDERAKVDAFVRRWNIKPGDRVLEPGCGSGRLTAILAPLTGPRGRILAFDASQRFIRLAAERNLPPHVSLRAARAEALRLAPASFDQVVCFNAFPHLVPQPVITRRLVMALRPGGTFWIAHTRSRGFVNAVHRRGPACLDNHRLPSPRRLARLLRGAGLDEVEIEDSADRFLARAVRPAFAVSSRTAR
jgi:demethylmenaquinone methyltransferase/2-methoxy-6-polyprenyl-1,4-benzoquinol methylase